MLEGDVDVRAELRHERLPARLVHDATRHTHAVEDGHVNDDGDCAVVQRLRAVRPHVRTLAQVDVAGMQSGLRLVVFEDVVGAHEVELALTLFEHVDVVQPETHR